MSETQARLASLPLFADLPDAAVAALGHDGDAGPVAEGHHRRDLVDRGRADGHCASASPKPPHFSDVLLEPPGVGSTAFLADGLADGIQ